MKLGGNWFLSAAVFLLVAKTAAADLSGHYVAPEEDAVTLDIRESANGAITGTLNDDGDKMPLQGRRAGNRFSGSLTAYGEQMSVEGTVEGDTLLLQFGDDLEDQLVFMREDTMSDPGTSYSGVTLSDDEATDVRVNRKALSNAELDRFEADYGIRIPSGDFWYDPVLGAWGAIGGPAMGQIAPGLPFSGALPADASGSGTFIFVNGRELHWYDVLALQQITGPITAGRYFITAEGLSGFEGGPVLWNLAAMASQSQGSGGGGGSNTWQSRITGASGFSDGNTSAVFLPNGGIVSTGD